MIYSDKKYCKDSKTDFKIAIRHMIHELCESFIYAHHVTWRDLNFESYFDITTFY